MNEVKASGGCLDFSKGIFEQAQKKSGANTPRRI